MNEAQLRHARSMAEKIRDHAASIVSEMSVIMNASGTDFTNVPLSNMVKRFTHDMGYGVQDRTDAIENVVRDMLPELES